MYWQMRAIISANFIKFQLKYSYVKRLNICVHVLRESFFVHLFLDLNTNIPIVKRAIIYAFYLNTCLSWGNRALTWGRCSSHKICFGKIKQLEQNKNKHRLKRPTYMLHNKVRTHFT